MHAGGVGAVRHGVLGSHGVEERGEGFPFCVREEAGEGGRGRREEDLLDFLGAGEVEEDGGAFDCGGAFEMVAGCPGCGTVVFCGGVEGAEVDDAHFVGV